MAARQYDTIVSSIARKPFRDSGQVLFLMVIGTILAIGYTQSLTEYPIFPLNEVSFTYQS